MLKFCLDFTNIIVIVNKHIFHLPFLHTDLFWEFSVFTEIHKFSQKLQAAAWLLIDICVVEFVSKPMVRPSVKI